MQPQQIAEKVAAGEVGQDIIDKLTVEDGWIIIWIGDIDAPAPLTFNVLGYEGSIRVYHYVGEDWHVEGEGDNPLTVNPESNSPFAVAIKRAAAPGPVDEPTPAEPSPKTGETMLPYAAIGVAMVAAAAAVVIRRKED